MNHFRKLKLIAIDTNGVLLKDVYSAPIKNFIERHGGVYTSEVERLVFGSPHAAGGHIMSVLCQKPWTAKETIDAFLIEQREFAMNNPVQVDQNITKTLELLHSTSARVISYGGSPKDVIFDKFLAPYANFFDRDIPYVNMGEFRPGMKEIARDVFQYNLDEVLFIDDLSRVAEVSKTLGCGFVGVPVTLFQREQMEKIGVRFILDSIGDLSCQILEQIDDSLLEGDFWKLTTGVI